MKRKVLKKSLVLVFALSLILGISVQAGISIKSKQICLGGTATAFYTKATGSRVSPISMNEYLYAGISRTGTGVYYGNPSGGNKVNLTATSPNMAGSISQMKAYAKVERR